MEVSKWPSLSAVLGLSKHKGSVCVCVCVFPLETQSTGLGSEDESPPGINLRF